MNDFAMEVQTFVDVPCLMRRLAGSWRFPVRKFAS